MLVRFVNTRSNNQIKMKSSLAEVRGDFFYLRGQFCFLFLFFVFVFGSCEKMNTLTLAGLMRSWGFRCLGVFGCLLIFAGLMCVFVFCGLVRGLGGLCVLVRGYV
jgi:uncharacterized protein YybS (DUF2232 family)